MYTEADILRQLDITSEGTSSEFDPETNSLYDQQHFLLDLEEGYCVIASSKIHLYADKNRWAIIFERSGYQNRAFRGEITLYYVGNCMDSLLENRPRRQYINNFTNIVLIDNDEFERIENKGVGEEETFELIAAEVKEIKIRNQMVAFNNNYKDYEQLGIKIKDYDNPKKLISFDNVLRYFNETNPALISATEEELRQYLPKDLPKLMALDSFHFMSRFEDDKLNVPSNHETFQLIAKVLAMQDPAHWKPTQEPNNHWSNWESGWL